MSSLFFHYYLGRRKKYLTAHQEQILTNSFHSKPYPENVEMHQLAQSLNLNKGKIKKWYENRRYQSRQAGLHVNGEEC